MLATIREARASGALTRQLRAIQVIPRCRWLRVRLLARAIRLGDAKAIVYSTAGRDLAHLLRLADGASTIVELGTYAGWTALTLAAAYPKATVVAVDHWHVPNREGYLAMHPAGARVEMVVLTAQEASGSRTAVDLLFIDVTHDEPTTRAAFEAWEPALRPGGLACFHDFNIDGVRLAIDGLGLEGQVLGETLFVWEKLQKK